MGWCGGGGVGVSFDYQLINFFFNFFLAKILSFTQCLQKQLFRLLDKVKVLLKKLLIQGCSALFRSLFPFKNETRNKLLMRDFCCKK